MTLQLPAHYLSDMLQVIASRPQSIECAANECVMKHRGGNELVRRHYIITGRYLAQHRRITPLCCRPIGDSYEIMYEVTG